MILSELQDQFIEETGIWADSRGATSITSQTLADLSLKPLLLAVGGMEQCDFEIIPEWFAQSRWRDSSLVLTTENYVVFEFTRLACGGYLRPFSGVSEYAKSQPRAYLTFFSLSCAGLISLRTLVCPPGNKLRKPISQYERQSDIELDYCTSFNYVACLGRAAFAGPTSLLQPAASFLLEYLTQTAAIGLMRFFRIGMPYPCILQTFRIRNGERESESHRKSL